MGTAPSQRTQPMAGDGSSSSCEEAEPSPEELLRLNPFQLGSFSRPKLRYMALFDVEHWASSLEGCSFPSAWADVTWEEAAAVLHAYQEGTCRQKGKVTEADRSALQGLRGKLEELMARLAPQAGEGFFVRLGPRSPKDAPMVCAEPWGLSEEKLRAALTEAGPFDLDPSTSDPCEVLRRFQTVCYRLLRVRTAGEAMALLQSSSRVGQDIGRTMDHGKDGWNMSVVVRAWDNDVSLDREFRTFVVRGKITAITQYCDDLCSSIVVEHRAEIAHCILEAMSHIAPLLDGLGLSDRALVADFAAVPLGDGSAWKAKLVELNPFGRMTGSSLFSWEHDRRLLQGGEDLFGDLHEHELKHPPARQKPVGGLVAEEEFGGVPFRYLTANVPTFTWTHLENFWPDYLQLLRS